MAKAVYWAQSSTLARRLAASVVLALIDTIGNPSEIMVAEAPERRPADPSSPVADMLQEGLAEGAADGFNLTPTHWPHGITAFGEPVVPELQRRGLFRGL